MSPPNQSILHSLPNHPPVSPTIASKAYGGLDNETKTFKTLVAVHGALMAFCFVILFPLGATLIHVLKRQSVVWFHGVWQIVTLLIALVGFGLGIYMVHHSRSNVSLVRLHAFFSSLL